MRPAVRTAAYVALVAGGTAASVQFWLRALTVHESQPAAPEAVPAIEQRVIPASVVRQHPRVGKQGAFVAVVRTPLTTPVRGGAPVSSASISAPPTVPSGSAPQPQPSAPPQTPSAPSATPATVVNASAPVTPAVAAIPGRGNPHLQSTHARHHGHAYGHDHARATPAKRAVPAQPSTPPTTPAIPATPAVPATPPGQAKRGSQGKRGNGHDDSAASSAPSQPEASDSHGNGHGHGTGK